MKRFLYRLSVFGLIAFICFYVVCLVVRQMGMSDWAYKRFTVGKQSSLIIGTSRSAQGIHPSVVNAMMKKRYSDIYNFSFTVTASPYGEIYYNAITRMLDSQNVIGGGKNLYILSVDPWGLSEEKEWDSRQLREVSSPLNEVRTLHKNPNMLYLALNFELRDFEWLQSFATLQDDGLYRVDFDMVHSDTAANIKQKLEIYNSYCITKSEYRLSWLCKTIDLLKQYGDVYMCRIPVHPGMLAIENRTWDSFDADMKSIASQKNVPYFSFTNRCGVYKTIDGNHLYKEDAALFTKELCDSILTVKF